MHDFVGLTILSRRYFLQIYLIVFNGVFQHGFCRFCPKSLENVHVRPGTPVQQRAQNL